jgi:tetracycline repressor-like protein
MTGRIAVTPTVGRPAASSKENRAGGGRSGGSRRRCGTSTSIGLAAAARSRTNTWPLLGDAALELCGERGFDNTSVAQTTERAGLTRRTFFRHFVDKREVLFSGSAALQEFLVSHVDGSPASLAPIDAITAALCAAADELF